MKTDLDSLMQSHNLDALLVMGAADHNPAMVYLTGGAHLTGAYLIKKRGQPPLLFAAPMEREEAARTGLETRDLGQYQLDKLLEQTGGDWTQALVLRLQHILQDAGVTSGRLAIYGREEIGGIFTILTGVQKQMPGLTLVGELMDSVMVAARMTKSQEEIQRLRGIGRATAAVVGKTAEFLTSQRVKEDVLVKADGSPLTIGEVKGQINLWLAERGAENPEGTIFAIGRDAGVPHSVGIDSDLLRLGQTLVFDIFPCEKGGGYFYDMTRTWCLGYAPDEALALYEDVLYVYRQVSSELRMGMQARICQARTCQLFQQRGHPTIQENPLTQSGYTHSVGHGVGLDVHERPGMRLKGADYELLDANTVFTLEPGLYYPERGMGVRLEDTLWMRPDGVAEVLADYPMDLVLPVSV